MTWLAIVTNRWIQLATGIFAAYAVGFGMGHHQKTLEDAAAALRGATRAVQAAAATSVIDQHTASQTAKTQDNTHAILQRVPIFISRKADDQCIVGRGAVQLLDLAAANAVPGAAVSLPATDPGLADADADSGVTLSAIISANTVNAGNYAVLAERLKSWDDWFDAQAKIAAH